MPAHLPRAHRSRARLCGRAGAGARRAAGARGLAGGLARVIPLLVAASLLNCGYSFTPSRLPSHIRSVAIPVFRNRTTEPGIEQEVTELVTREFVIDNKLQVVPEARADSGLYGEIIRYQNRVFAYNAAAQTEEYEVLVEVMVEFKDLVKRKSLWKEESIVGRTTYFVVETTGQVAKDEITGRSEAIKRLAEDILNRTVRSWG